MWLTDILQLFVTKKQHLISFGMFVSIVYIDYDHN